MSVKGGHTLSKAMVLLRDIAAAEEGATFTELMAASKQPRATLHRLIQSLLDERLARLDADDRRYHLGLGLLELAGLTWSRLDVRRAGSQTLRQLSRDSGEAVHMAVLDDVDVVYIDKIESPQRIRMTSAIGMRNPPYCTGVGKALLAFLDADTLNDLLSRMKFHRFTPRTLVSRKALMAELGDIHGKGYAEDNEEHEAGIRCVAAPIFDLTGHPIAAISVTAPTFRCDDARAEEFVGLTIAAATQITRNCGGSAPAFNRQEAAASGATS